MGKIAHITDDRYDDGTTGFWVDLGDGDGIDDQHQCRTLEEAKRLCTDHLLPEGGIICHFSHGELETTYTVKGAANE